MVARLRQQNHGADMDYRCYDGAYHVLENRMSVELSALAVAHMHMRSLFGRSDAVRSPDERRAMYLILRAMHRPITGEQQCNSTKTQ